MWFWISHSVIDLLRSLGSVQHQKMQPGSKANLAFCKFISHFFCRQSKYNSQGSITFPALKCVLRFFFSFWHKKAKYGVSNWIFVLKVFIQHLQLQLLFRREKQTKLVFSLPLVQVCFLLRISLKIMRSPDSIIRDWNIGTNLPFQLF